MHSTSLDNNILNAHEININELIEMPVKKYESLNGEDRIVSNIVLREHCIKLKKGYKPTISPTQVFMAKTGPMLRHFDLNYGSVPGASNIPDDGCIILLNHSNSHDGFIIAETLEAYGHPCTFLAGSEGLSFLERMLFVTGHATMIDRLDKESCSYGLVDFAGKVAHGDTGVIFGEGTWNLHPYWEMLPMKIGAVKVAAITGKPIIPTIMEYKENLGIIKSESDLYSSCTVCCGNPIYVNPEDSYVEVLSKAQKEMERLRRDTRKMMHIDKSAAKFDPEEYINHTWLKKYGTRVFEYDSEREFKFVRGKDGALPENEYYYNEKGILVPRFVPKDLYAVKKKVFRGIKIDSKNNDRETA